MLLSQQQSDWQFELLFLLEYSFYSKTNVRKPQRRWRRRFHRGRDDLAVEKIGLNRGITEVTDHEQQLGHPDIGLTRHSPAIERLARGNQSTVTEGGRLVLGTRFARIQGLDVAVAQCEYTPGVTFERDRSQVPISPTSATSMNTCMAA